MAINDHGFLGKDIEIFKKEIYEKYNELFEFYREVNHFLQILKFKLQAIESEDRKIAIITQFVKALETFQSVYIVCSYGLTIDAEVLNRALYETTVKISYCSKGEDNHKRYLATELRNRIKSINIIKNNPKVYARDIFRIDELDSRKSLFEEMLNELGNPAPINVGGMAKKGGLGDMYDSFYQVASETVHTAPRSLEDYIAIDEGRKIKVLWGPRSEKIDIQLFAAIEFMLFSSQCLSEIFGEPRKEEIIFLNRRKESIYFKYKERG